jgi:hypothetical protein
MAARRQLAPMRHTRSIDVTDGTMCRMPSPFTGPVRAADGGVASHHEYVAINEVRGTVPLGGLGHPPEAHIPVPGFASLFIHLNFGPGVSVDGPLFVQDTTRTAYVKVAQLAGSVHYVWQVAWRVVELPHGSPVRLWRYAGGIVKSTGFVPAAYGLQVGKRAWDLLPAARHCSWADGSPVTWTEHWFFEALSEAARAERAG